jgi:hypothetical protein
MCVCECTVVICLETFYSDFSIQWKVMGASQSVLTIKQPSYVYQINVLGT